MDRKASAFVLRIGGVALLLMAAETPAAPGDTELVATNRSDTPSVSADGRFIAFRSESLLDPLYTGSASIFVKDLQTGSFELASDGGSMWDDYDDGTLNPPAISADGRYVAFCGGNYSYDPRVYIRDRLQGTLRKVVINGRELRRTSCTVGLSGDGRYLAFDTVERGLVAADQNDFRDVFVLDRTTGTVEWISSTPLGAAGNGPSEFSSISADGRFVALSSNASNFVAGDTNGATDSFVHERVTRRKERINVGPSGEQLPGGGGSGRLSRDGRFVAFTSTESGIVPNDTNAMPDVFVRDRSLKTTERVSVSSGERQANGSTWGHSISADGRFVAFESSASNLVIGDYNGVDDIFVRDRQQGTTERASVRSSGAETTIRPSRSFWPSLSGDGRFVAFSSSSTDLVPGATRVSVFVHEVGGTILWAYSVKPDRHDFGDTEIGTSAYRTFVVTNEGNRNLPILSMELRGPDKTLFTFNSDCPSTLAPAASCTVVVAFRPTTMGSKEAEFRISFDAGGSSVVRSRQLTGVGASLSAATFTVRPRSLAFGTVAVGATTSAQTVTVTNTGTIGLPIKWIGLAGIDRSEFGRARKCPAVLEAGRQCTASVVFKPTSPGEKAARLVVSAGGTRKSTALSGTGR